MPKFEILDTDARPQLTVKDFLGNIIIGDCTEVMPHMPNECVDFILTDPPYLVNYHDRTNRSYANDDPNNASWLKPAFAEAYRVLKPDKYMVCFYGYTQADKFIEAWRAAGFRILEHLVWTKNYCSSEGHVKRCHEEAYLLAKGKPFPTGDKIRDVIHWQYSGNDLHPSQKPESALIPLVQSFSKSGDVILDPFAGSCTTLLASKSLGRKYIGIELSKEYAEKGAERLRN